MFCGWDWGSTQHGVCLIDDHGVVIKTWMIAHTKSQLLGEGLITPSDRAPPCEALRKCRVWSP